ncbi:NYN domain-containing protein [Actinomadura sp. NTSP31]|uniref:NYN domain-containing protein n=1 Tax=Actinomadura sp. NTSP31 TaxID=1735447 RepID=UPI0035BF8BD8
MTDTKQPQPSPTELSRIVQRRSGQATVPAAQGVLFAYVDNSNVWIEGQRIQAVHRGLARDPYDAMARKISAPWAYDFGRLYEIMCPLGSNIGRSLLVGSRPPPNDSVWDRARNEGFEVDIFDRNASNKEKQVDSHIVTTMMEDSFIHMNPERADVAVLAAGDGDYLPTVRSLQKRHLKVRVVFWKHATSRELRDTADEFVALDQRFDRLTLSPRS